MSSDLNKRLMTLGILGIIVLALFLGARLIKSNADNPNLPPTPDPFSADQNVPIFGDAQFGAVTRLTVQDNQSGALFKAELDEEGAWLITAAPPGTDTGLGVDSPRLDSTLASIPALRPNNVLSDVEAMVTYGLTEPNYSIWLTFDIGQTYNLFVGDSNPGDTAFYTIVSGHEGQVYLLPKFALQSLIDFLENPPFIQPIEGEDGGEGDTQ